MDGPAPRHTTDYSSPFVFLAPHFEQARLSDILGQGPGAGFLQLSGGTMTGPIVLGGFPQLPMHAVNKAYVDNIAGGYVDAPNDGRFYGRWFGQWEPVLALSGGVMTGRMLLAEDAVDLLSPVTLRQIAPLLGDFLPVAGGAMLGPLILARDALDPLEAVTLQQIAPLLGDFLPLTGGTLTGGLTINADAYISGHFGAPLPPTSGEHLVNQNYVDTALGAYVPLTGGAMTGLLSLSGNPQVDAHAANKLYVDTQIASQALYQGIWQVQVNAPDLSNLNPPPLHGYSWIAVVFPADAQAPAPPSMPGIGGVMMNNGDTVIWNDLLSTWERVIGSGLTRLQADALYVSVDGDLMIGPLRIIQSGPPNLTLSSSGTATASDLLFGAANTVRWTLRKEATVQGDLSLMAWNTAGTVATEVLHFDRTLSNVTLTGGNFIIASDGSGLNFASGIFYKAFGVNQPLVIRLPVGNPMLQVEDSTGLNRRRLLDEFTGVWRAGDTMLGPLDLFRDPVGDMEAATKQYVDNATPAAGIYLPLTGGTLTGNLQLPLGTVAAPSLSFGLPGDSGFSRTGTIINVSIQGNSTVMFSNGATFILTPLSMGGNLVTNIADAASPTDALNRRTGDARYAPIAAGVGAPFLPLTGGTMQGDIWLPANPTQDMHATTKIYVDTAVASGTSYQGTWEVALNQPNLLTAQPLAGYRYLCRTADPAVGETPPVAIPGLTGRTIFDGDFILWDQPLMQWDLLHAGGLTKLEADTFYVQLGGSTMTGPLVLNGPPQADLHAATKAYVDANAGGGGPGGGIPEPPPGSPPQGRTTSAGGGTSSWLPVLPLTGGQLSGTLQINGANLLIVGNAATLFQMMSQTGGSFAFANRGSDIFALQYTTTGVPNTTDRMVMNVPNNLTTFTGNVAAADPTAATHLATRAYVDGLVGTGVADYLPLTGGTLTGPLFLPAGPPPAVLAATTKQYVDNLVATVVGIAVFIGAMDASTADAQCIFTALSGIPNGPLPLANAVVPGSHLIVTIAGMPTQGPVAGIPFDSGDWVISDGTNWFRLAFGGTNVVAAGVAVVPSVFGAFTVQQSLQNASDTLLRKTSPDNLSFILNAGAHPVLSWAGVNPVGPPSITARSAGTRLVLYSGTNGADFALGIEGSTLWYQANAATANHRWYGGATQYMNLNNGGLNLPIGGITVASGTTNLNTAGGTGTALQTRGQVRILKPTNNNDSGPQLAWADNSNRNLAWFTGVQTAGVVYYNTPSGAIECWTNQGGYRAQLVWRTDFWNLRVSNDLYCRTLSQTSDASFKTDIAPVDADEVAAAFAELAPVRFKWKAPEVGNPLAAPDGKSSMVHPDPDRLQWGFIAQDVERVAPDLVHDSDTDGKSVDLGGLVSILWAKVQQLEARLDGVR